MLYDLSHSKFTQHTVSLRLPCCLQLHHHHQIPEWAKERRIEGGGDWRRRQRGGERNLPLRLMSWNTSSAPLDLVDSRCISTPSILCTRSCIDEYGLGGGGALHLGIPHLGHRRHLAGARVGPSPCMRHPQLHLDLYHNCLTDLRRTMDGGLGDRQRWGWGAGTARGRRKRLGGVRCVLGRKGKGKQGDNGVDWGTHQQERRYDGRNGITWRRWNFASRSHGIAWRRQMDEKQMLHKKLSTLCFFSCKRL